MTYPRPTSSRAVQFLLILALVVAAALIYGRYLRKDHFTASGDFPPAVSYALNYRLAVEHGQWVPRLVVIPRDVSLGLGSIDGTVPTADAPDFQYYGFLQSALAWPFLLAGVPGIKAVQWVVLIAFSSAAIILYAAGRVLGARPGVAFLAGYSYIISPWLVSNFYGRGGISEALGQASLALLVLGFAFLKAFRWRAAIAATATGIASLALSHNIFLLYGAVLCALFGAGTILFPVHALAANPTWRDRATGVGVIGLGGALGLALTAWQWLPATLTMKEMSFSYFGAFSEAGMIPGKMADWSGVWGVPKQYVEPWSGNAREFFFTIGWWTVPAVLSLAFCGKAVRRAAGVVAIAFLVFVALLAFPKYIYPHLPGAFGATQFNFRLLAYLSVIGSLALCLAWPRLHTGLVVAVLGLVTLSQWKVITFPMPPGGGTTELHEEQYLKGSEYNAFYANSSQEKNLRFWYDGWMQPANTLELSTRPWTLRGKTSVETLPPANAIALRIKGRVADDLPPSSLKLARAADPTQAESAPVALTAPTFDVTLTTTNLRDPLRLVIDPALPAEKKAAHTLRPEEVHVMWGNPRSLVYAGELERRAPSGYTRIFTVPAAARAAHVVDPTGHFVIELPMVYSRFFNVEQNGRPLETAVDMNHRLMTRTRDLDHAISVVYRLPLSAWALTLAGVAGAIALGFFPLRGRRAGPVQ